MFVDCGGCTEWMFFELGTVQLSSSSPSLGRYT